MVRGVEGDPDEARPPEREDAHGLVGRIDRSVERLVELLTVDGLAPEKIVAPEQLPRQVVERPGEVVESELARMARRLKMVPEVPLADRKCP